MSDQPTSNDGATTRTADLLTALRDVRWLSGLIWVGLLAALLVTSAYGITAFTQGSIATKLYMLPVQASVNTDSISHSIAVAGLIASGLAAGTLLLAWWSFVRATRAVVIAYASEDGDAATSPVAAEWVLDDGSPNTPTRIPVADVLLYVGVTWAVLILTPAFLNAVVSFQ